MRRLLKRHIVMEKCCQIANLYIATLRSIYLVEQHCHWMFKKNYGDHLLFQRLYEGAQENADLAAEKCIGVLGNDAVDYDMQCDFIKKIYSKYSNLKDEPLKQALTIEKGFLALSKEAFDFWEKDGKMTLGLDDAVCLIASKREESCYLLQRALEDIKKEAQFQPSGKIGDPLDPSLPTFETKTQISTKPIEKQKPTIPTSSIPNTLKAALDHHTPHLKGSLFLDIKGNGVNVNYNADKIKGNATDIQKMVEKAIGPLGFKVVQTIGFSRPTWHPNYI